MAAPQPIPATTKAAETARKVQQQYAEKPNVLAEAKQALSEVHKLDAKKDATSVQASVYRTRIIGAFPKAEQEAIRQMLEVALPAGMTSAEQITFLNEFRAGMMTQLEVKAGLTAASAAPAVSRVGKGLPSTGGTQPLSSPGTVPAASSAALGARPNPPPRRQPPPRSLKQGPPPPPGAAGARAASAASSAALGAGAGSSPAVSSTTEKASVGTLLNTTEPRQHEQLSQAALGAGAGASSGKSQVEKLAGLQQQAVAQQQQLPTGTAQPLTPQQKAQRDSAEDTRDLTTANTNVPIQTIKSKFQGLIEGYNKNQESKLNNKRLELKDEGNKFEVYLCDDKQKRRVYTVEPEGSGVKITFDPIIQMNLRSAQIAIEACESPVKIRNSTNLNDLQHLADAAAACKDKKQLIPSEQVLGFLKDNKEFNDPKNAEKYKNLRAVYEAHRAPTVKAEEGATSLSATKRAR